MRVLLVVHGYPPAGSGGTEIYVHSLALALRAQGEEVFVLAREADPGRPDFATREETVDGLRVLRVNNTYREVRSFRDSYLSAPVRRIAGAWIEEVRPDVAHLHHLTGLSGDLPLECARRGLPAVLTLHDYWLICHRGQLLDRDLRRCAGPLPDGCSRCLGEAAMAESIAGAAAAGARLARALARRLPSGVVRPFRRVAAAAVARDGQDAETLRRARALQQACRAATRCLALSRTVHERFLAFGVEAARLEPHELGLDLAPFRGLQWTPGEGRLRIGFLGSLMVSKAPHLAIEAFGGLPPERASLHLFGAHAAYHGDDRYRTRLEPLLRLPGVHYGGPLPHDRVPAALAGLDVVVVPSVWLENSPLVIREAFAAGVPVVAAALGGMAEMVEDGRSGLLFRPGDAADLRRCLTRLLEEPGLRARLRDGIPPVKDISEDAACTRRIYAECLAEVGAGRRHRASTPAAPRLAAVVLNYRTPEDTLLAVRSLQASRREVQHVVVVDNHSRDGSVELLRRHLPEVELLEAGHNLGFSGGCNLGLTSALRRGAELVLLLNSDVVLPPDSLGALEDALSAEAGAGIAGPLLLSRAHPDRVASAGMRLSRASGRMRHLQHGEPAPGAEPIEVRRVDGVAGCALLVRREVLEAAGLLADEYFFSFEDLDFCLRARRAGYLTICARGALGYHEGCRSIGAHAAERLYYGTRNHLLLAQRLPAAGGSLGAAVRAVCILGFNLAYALTGSGTAPLPALGAVLRGARHHCRGRYGPASDGGESEAQTSLSL
jgi:GT2 family glycosyltransferase/glycosyltransferase involved in cell wall biosynthesis